MRHPLLPALFCTGLVAATSLLTGTAATAAAPVPSAGPTSSSAAEATAPTTDVRERLDRIPGLTVVSH
ncbi:hypothetical protein [Streptomyces sp. NPDC057582]|uniref:hypothetical protein n=1 Tax=unclassified Streptomyces TaxID=2593676 RepID=UPI0036C55099